MKRFILTLIVLGLSAVLLPYVIYLKDGSTYQAKEKYRVDKGMAIITLTNGTVISVDLRLIDAARTEQANKSGMDADMILDTGGATAAPVQSAKPTSLGQIAKGAGALSSPTALGSNPSKAAGAGTKSKDADFSDESVRRAFAKIFENVNLFEYKIIQGSTPSTVRINMTTDNEKDVFNALTASARVMNELKDLGKTSVTAIEIYLSTTSGAAAGRFTFGLDAARILADGQVPVEQFFIDQVLF
jgi:hypothetical protein